MKHLLILVLGIFLFLPISSQTTNSFTEKKNVFAIGYFNAFELKNMPEFGFGYKRLIKKGSLRTSVGWNTENTENSYFGGGSTTSTDNNIALRVGYEHHENYNRLQFNYGGDLVYKYSVNENYDWNADETINRRHYSQSYKLSIRPSIGLTVFLIPFISISTETFLDIGYGKSENYDKRYNPDGSTQEGSGSGEQGPSVMIGPLGVFSINFHF